MQNLTPNFTTKKYRPAMLKRIVHRILFLMILCGPFLCAAQTEPASERRESAVSSEELQRWLQKLSEWDRIQVDPNLSQVAGDVFLYVLPGLQKAGSTAFAIAPGIAKLLTTTTKNWTTFAQVLIEITPPMLPDEVASLAQAARGGDAETRVLALARLARSKQPQAIAPLRDAARVYHDTVQRVMGTMALGYSGHMLPEIAATALVVGLRDRERVVRSTAVDSLGRMCSSLQSRIREPQAKILASFATDYLQIREDPQGAVIVLRCLPLEAAAQAKGQLQKLVDDPAVAEFNKANARILLAQLVAVDRNAAGEPQAPRRP
jgi:hypothetical protein